MRSSSSIRVARNLMISPPGGPRSGVDARRSKRVSAPSALGLLLKEPRGVRAARVNNFSYEGLQFLLPHDTGQVPWHRGRAVVATLHDDPGGDPLPLTIEVLFTQNSNHGTVCGGRVVPREQRVRDRYRLLVANHIHPRTRIGAYSNESVWSLYAKSGYFGLSNKDPSAFEDLRLDAFEVAKRLDGKEDVGFRVVHHADGPEVTASVSMIRPYTNTWMGHQMAKNKDPYMPRSESRRILRELYERAYEPFEPGEDFAWMLGYCEGHVRWMQIAHLEFAERHAATGLACVVPLRLIEVPCEPTRAPRTRTLSIEEATPQEIDQVLCALAATRPRAYVEALDLVPERFALPALRARWGAAHMIRTRNVLVARVDGVACVAAILESAERGTNLFNMLDAVRLVPLGPLPAELRESAATALLQACRGQYWAKGRSAFVYLCESKERAHAAPFRDLGDGYTWIVSSLLRNEFLQHIRNLTVDNPRLGLLS